MELEERIIHLEAHCARGWKVFPCNGKVPATRTGVYAGSDDIVKWRTQWAQRPQWNIGIWTGGSDLLVVDCDLDKENPSSWAGPFDDDGVNISVKPKTPGITDWIRICGDNDFDFESTYCVSTPSGGLHTYFAYDSDAIYVPPGTGVLGDLVDIRASGSYVVAVGSEIDGYPYELIGTTDVLAAPDWLIDLLAVKPKTMDEVADVVQARREDRQHYEDGRIKWLSFMCEDVESAPVGTRNVTFAQKAYRIWMAGGDDVDFDVLTSSGRQAGLDDREMAACIKATMRQPR